MKYYPTPEEDPTPTCVGTSYSLNDYRPQYDGQWQGINVASDGCCYFGSSTHSDQHGAGFFRFDPEKRELTMIAEDMTTVCGESVEEGSPQGKIHSPIVEADGWLYFTTHLSTYWDEAIEAYPGAHVLGYELATGEFRDFGILKPRYTIYSGIGVDPERKKLYAFSMPFSEKDAAKDGCHLFRIDIPSGEKEDLGRIGPRGTQGACFWFYIDNTGDCWFSVWKKGGFFTVGGEGTLYRVPVGTDRVEEIKDILPDCRLRYPDGQFRPESEEEYSQRAWTWVGALPDRKSCLFLMGQGAGEDERLWSFTPGKGIFSGNCFRSIGQVGPTFLSVALGKDRLFYVQRGSLRKSRNWSDEAAENRDPNEFGFMFHGHLEDMHLKSIALDPANMGTVTDHGRLVDQDGRMARQISSLAVDEKGRVYVVGSWHLLPGEKGTQAILWETTREFAEVKRKQRFAWFDVSEEI